MVGGTTSVIIVVCFLLTALIPFLGSTEVIADQPGEIEVTLSARGTFLRAEPFEGDNPEGGSNVEGPLILDLQANGILSDMPIRIDYDGQICIDAFWNGQAPVYISAKADYIDLLGVFSTDSQLRPITELNRIPGAIDYGADYLSDQTYFKSLSTDIPEDFKIIPNNEIIVPHDAKYLFFCIDEGGYYPDDLGTVQIYIENAADTDGDGLLDSWEKDGIDFDEDGKIDLDLKALGADWQHKDIFVEVDYMEGHKPMDAAMADVKAAFSRAPNALVDNPDKKDGVNLHILVDEQINHQDVLYVWEGFDLIKSSSFGSFDQRTAGNRDEILLAKKMVFRYCLFINQFAMYDNKSSSFVPSNASGMSELPGNDFIVSLGTFNTHGGTRDEQAATFMHELGHSLNLRHGGDVNENYKPNYLSIMNYLFVFEGDPIPNRPLDYSRSTLPTINENALDEMMGVSPNAYEPSYHANWVMTAYSDASGQPNSSSLNPINWNNDSSFNSSVSADINNFVCWHWPSGKKTPLTGYEDWSRLLYDFKKTAEYADGMHQPVMDEITSDIAELMSEYRFEVLPTPNPDGGGDNTMLYLGIGVVAILAVAGAAFVMMRRKK